MISSEMSFNDLGFHKADALSRNRPLIQSLSKNCNNYYWKPILSLEDLYKKEKKWSAQQMLDEICNNSFSFCLYSSSSSFLIIFI